MNLMPQISCQNSEENHVSFWQRIVGEAELRNSLPLEKLLVGCEIIAALDDAELLAA